MTHSGSQIEETEAHSVPLWLMPLLLLVMAFEAFADRLRRMKELRRERALPANWRDRYPRLRGCEWQMRELLANGAQQVLAGNLVLAAIPMIPAPPEEFVCPMPQSALAMYRRIEAITRFHADPERYIRRHAARMLRREPVDAFGRRLPPADSTEFTDSTESTDAAADDDEFISSAATSFHFSARGPPPPLFSASV